MGQSFCKFVELICCCPRPIKLTRDEKSRRKEQNDKRKSHKDTSKATIDTNWETMEDSSLAVLTPSQIPDEILTREVQSTHIRELNNELNFDKQVLAEEGYDIVKNDFIGRGGAAIVYKVRDKLTGAMLAAKVSVLLKAKGIESISRPRFESFKNEIFTLRRNPHKNIIKLKEHFLCNKSISFIIMEFANAGSLEERQKKHGKEFDEETSRYYFVQISNAIIFLHSRGIIHGDLKLPNVLVQTIGDKELIKVTDFGCSRVAFRKDAGTILKSNVFGTVSYMSPEQIAVYIGQNLKRRDLVKGVMKRYDPLKADCWSLGVCLYKLVHFSRPFDYNERTDPLDMLKMLNSMKKGFQMETNILKKLSNDCIQLIEGLLEYDRHSRIDTRVLTKMSWVIQSAQYDPIGH